MASVVSLLVAILSLYGALPGVHGWKTKHEYQFQLNGRTVADLPVAGVGIKATGVHYNGHLRLQTLSSDVLLMQVRNFSYTRMFKDMPDGWWRSERDPEDSTRSVTISDSTFSAKLKNGLVENLVVTSSLENWQLNFIQGIVSHLQLDLTGSSARHNPRSNSMHGRGDYEGSTSYTVKEDSVSGRCNVDYHLNEIPKQVMWANPSWASHKELCGSRPFLEVTKTRNYSSCEKNPEYHFGLPVSSSCPPGDGRCGDLWTRAALTRLVGCGSRRDFLLLAAVSSNRVVANLHLHNGSEAAVSSYVNLTLVSMKGLTSGHKLSLPSPPTRRLQSLTYRYSGPYSQMIDPEPSRRRDTQNERHPVRNSNSTAKSKRHHHKIQDMDSNSSSEEGEESPSVWDVPETSLHRPPHRPFSGFALSHREGVAHSCMNQQFRELVTDIAADLDNPRVIQEKRTMEKVNLAVEMCRTMMMFDLQKSHPGIMDMDSHTDDSKRIDTERKVLRDIYVMCGTNPAFSILKTWITQRKLRGEEAAEVIASLPKNLQTPNAEVVQQFYELARSSAVGDNQQVKISAVLAFSNLLRVACVNTKYRQARYTMALMGHPCSSTMAGNYVPWLKSEPRSTPLLHRALLTALGNTAHPLAVRELKKAAEDSNLTPYMRSAAIFSMRHLIFADPRQMNNILLDLFYSYKNPTAVRLAAVAMLMYSKPGLAVWQRIAISTWYEPCPAVISFVWSSLSSMATADDIVYQDMFQSARAVLPLARRTSQANHLPHNLMRTSVSSHLSRIILEQLSYSGDIHASHIYFRRTERLGKLTTFVNQAEITAANPDGLMHLVLEFMNPKENTKISRPPISNWPRSTRWIHDELKIEARTLPRTEGDLHITLNNLYERILPFDKTSINSFLKAGKKAVEQMKVGERFNMQKMDQEGIEIATTNEMGFPVALRVKRLWAFQSSLEAELTSDHLNLGVNISATYASQLMAELTAFHEWDSVEHVAASYVTTLVNIPTIKVMTSINKGDSQVELQLQFAKVEEDNKLVHHSSRPLVAHRDIFNLTPLSLVKNSYSYPLTDQREIVRIPHLDINYASNAEPRTLVGWLKSDMTVYGAPMVWNTIEPATFELTAYQMPPVKLNFTMATAAVKEGRTMFRIVANRTLLQDGQATESSTEATTMPPETTLPPTTATSTENSTMSTTTSTEWPNNSGDDFIKMIVDNVEPRSASEFNVTTMDPFTRDLEGSYLSYILTRVLSGMNNGEAVAIQMNCSTGADSPTNYEGIFAYGVDLGANTKRASLNLRELGASWSFGVSGSAYVVPGPLLDVKQIVDRNVTMEFSADFLSRVNDSTSTLSVQGTVSRSKEQSRRLLSSQVVRQCLDELARSGPSAQVHTECQSAVQLATFSDHLTAHLTTQSTDSDDSTLRMLLSGVSTSLDFCMQPPLSQVDFKDVNVSLTLPSSLLHYNPGYATGKQLLSADSCGVTADNVTTYDGVRFQYLMGDCWHVLSKDCSGKSRVVVLARTRENVMVVEINVDNYRIISLLPDLQIALNEKLIPLSPLQVAELKDLKGSTIMQLSTGSDRSIRVHLPEHEMTVVYANSSALITAGFGTRGRLCGLCGDNNGESIGDLKTPRGVLEQSPEDFAFSYALQDDTCQAERRG